MLEYLKQAFRAGADVPGLGRVPLNLLAVLAFGILGFGHPLSGCWERAPKRRSWSCSPRTRGFRRRWRRSQEAGEAELRQTDLERRLEPAARRRFDALQEKCSRALEVAREAHERRLRARRPGPRRGLPRPPHPGRPGRPGPPALLTAPERRISRQITTGSAIVAAIERPFSVCSRRCRSTGEEELLRSDCADRRRGEVRHVAGDDELAPGCLGGAR